MQDISPEVRGYLAADQKKKKVIDNQFKAAKTSARLHSRMMWYEWRSNLLDDLQRGLARIEEGFRNDDSKLGTKEVQLQTLHSELRSRHEQLLQETEGLERRRREIDEADPAEAAAADEVLAFIQAQVTEKEQKVAYLKKEKEEKAIQLKNLSERQHEVNQVLRDAQVRHDECRGWTAKEVSSLKGIVSTSHLPRHQRLTAVFNRKTGLSTSKDRLVNAVRFR